MATGLPSNRGALNGRRRHADRRNLARGGERREGRACDRRLTVRSDSRRSGSCARGCAGGGGRGNRSRSRRRRGRRRWPVDADAEDAERTGPAEAAGPTPRPTKRTRLRPTRRSRRRGRGHGGERAAGLADTAADDRPTESPPPNTIASEAAPTITTAATPSSQRESVTAGRWRGVLGRTPACGEVGGRSFGPPGRVDAFARVVVEGGGHRERTAG